MIATSLCILMSKIMCDCVLSPISFIKFRDATFKSDREFMGINMRKIGINKVFSQLKADLKF